jgi:hypothetical protein
LFYQSQKKNTIAELAVARIDRIKTGIKSMYMVKPNADITPE